MRAIKFLVFAMGVVLIVGFTVVVVEIVRRSSTLKTETAAADVAERPAAADPAAATGRAFDGRLDLPEGARLGEVAATSSRVVLHVIMPDGEDILYSFDPVTGEIAGSLRIVRSQ